MTNDPNRDRFQKLLEAKKQARSNPKPGERQDGRPGRAQPPKADRTFKRRKV